MPRGGEVTWACNCRGEQNRTGLAVRLGNRVSGENDRTVRPWVLVHVHVLHQFAATRYRNQQLTIFIERVTTVWSAQSGRGSRSETVIVPQSVASRDIRTATCVAARIIPEHVRVRRQHTRPLHTQHKESEVNVDAVLQLPSAKTGALHA